MALKYEPEVTEWQDRGILGMLASMESGFLNVLKPPGMTSHDVVARLRRRLPRGTKVGHLGTLDPAACGVLPLAIGWATRLIPCLPQARKVYLAELQFGWRSDTLDGEGLLEKGSLPPADLQQQLLPLLTEYRGEILQVPPRVSALKQDGQRAYDRARRGEEFELPPRPAHYFEVRWVACKADRVRLRVDCGPGTYIRSLARDLGERLGCGAILRFLLRLQSGLFHLPQAHCLEELEDPGPALLNWDWPWREQPVLELAQWPPPPLDGPFSGLASHPKGMALYEQGQKVWSREGVQRATGGT